MELHPVELAKQVVRELDVGLVDLVDQQHRALIRGEGLPKAALADVVGDVVDAVVAELAVAQARDGIVFVQALLRLGGRLDVPLDQVRPEGRGDFLRQHGLARARLALHQQRSLQRDRRIDRDPQIFGGDIAGRAFEAHGFPRQTDLVALHSMGRCKAAQDLPGLHRCSAFVAGEQGQSCRP